jgi:hypothetical protein
MSKSLQGEATPSSMPAPTPSLPGVRGGGRDPRAAREGGGGHAIARQPNTAVPAKAGTHSSAIWDVDRWVPAFAGTAVYVAIALGANRA